MNNNSFEEKLLSRNINELNFISAEINNEFELIYKELDRNGKWNDFVKGIDNIELKDDNFFSKEILPENYYECFHFAFCVLDKYEELNSKVGLAFKEVALLNGDPIENFELPQDAIDLLGSLGICIESEKSVLEPIRNEHFKVRIKTLYVNSGKLKNFMEKALKTLKESKSFIFSR